MHMVRGRIDVSQMSNGTRRPTLRTGFDVTFYRFEEGGAVNTYVEVNEVRARIVDGDICVRNGIIHQLNTAIGFPTHTLWESISQNPDLGFVLHESVTS